jgi:hypothetical protein
MPVILKLSLAFALPLTMLIAISVWASVVFDSDTPLMVPVAAAGLFGFVFFLGLELNEKSQPKLQEGALRGAIATAIIIEYVVLVSIVAFFKSGPETLPPITQTLITNFTTIVGLVVAFYFGTSAYLQAQKKASRAPDGSPQEKPPGI